MGVTVVIDGAVLRPEHVVEIGHGAKVVLAGEARARMDDNARAHAGWPSVLRQKRKFLVGDVDVGDEDLASTFILAHCAGVGEPLPAPIVRGMMACRANVLAVGASGARPEAADALIAMLNAGVTPVVPSQGSVGAAGDLAPLAHVARAVCGLGGECGLPGGGHGRSPLPAFRPTDKEALSLINGATLASSLASFAIVRAERVLGSMELAAAMTMAVLGSDARCLDARAVALRGHAEAQAVAARVSGYLGAAPTGSPDAFSIRAIPAVLGAAWSALKWARRVTTTELNGACDNPLWIDGEVLETGNFHGAPLAVVMDALRLAMVQAVTQSERRTFRLSSGALTGDLPSFLVEGTGLNSGFMLAQYTAASLASECKGLAHPAVVDSIPTVQHHEDHVSMAPIAGRLSLRVLECAADVVAIEALLAAQGLEFRREGRALVDGALADVATRVLSPAVERGRAAVRSVVPRWRDDQVMHPSIAGAGRIVREGGFLAAAGTDGSRPMPW
jgi:histidine ammonia-lyase